MKLKLILGVLGAVLAAVLGGGLYRRRVDEEARRREAEAIEKALRDGDAAAHAAANAEVERIRADAAAESALPRSERVKLAYQRALAAGYGGDRGEGS